MDSPLISVLVPCYNQSRYIGKTLESVLAQKNVAFEILVSDDASTDGTDEIVRQFAARDARVRFIRHEKNLGMANNWNWCLEQSRGGFIKFVFGDDYLTTPDALAQLQAPLLADQSITLVTSSRQIVDVNGNLLRTTHDFLQTCRLSGTEIITRCLLENKNLIGEPSAVLFRRSAATTPFDRSYRQLIDLEFWFRLLMKGDFTFLQSALCAFRRHEEQQTALNQPGRLGEREGIRLHLQYGALIDGYLASGGSMHLVRQAQFRTIYYANKAAVRSVDQIADETLLRKQLKHHWYLIYWLHHRLTKPIANLRKALGLPARPARN